MTTLARLAVVAAVLLPAGCRHPGKRPAGPPKVEEYPLPAAAPVPPAPPGRP